jgi:26S proteasome regulatory subunit N7
MSTTDVVVKIDHDDQVYQLPNLKIPEWRFLISIGEGEQFLDLLRNEVKENGMVTYYKELCDQFGWEVDHDWITETDASNEAKINALDEAITDAELNLGESEVRIANLAKSNFLLKIGRKEAAETSYRYTTEKTVGIGQRLDIVFTLIRTGFFYSDFDLVTRNIEKAKSMIELGGDWDKRNRLKVYEGYFFYTTRKYADASRLFLDGLSTFNCPELISFKEYVRSTVIASIVSLERVKLRETVVDSPEVRQLSHELTLISEYLNSFYDCEYSTFFKRLADVTDELKLDRFFSPHIKFYCREMRLKAYAQYLEPYLSVQLDSMAEAFGVTQEFIDKELSRFISLKRLDCKVDKVAGVVETVRPNSKNALYHKSIKQGDALLNRLQNLSRVIHL